MGLKGELRRNAPYSKLCLFFVAVFVELSLLC